jgi:4-hydroxymandelate oxidase
VRPVDLAEYEHRVASEVGEDLARLITRGAPSPSSVTHSHNLEAFQEVRLRPRVLVDVSERHLGTTVLGQEISLPVMLDPIGGQGRFHTEGELASARAAGRAQTLMVLSTVSSHSLEQVAAAATGPLWFQLYIQPNRDITEVLIRRAQASGYKAVVVTVDQPVHWADSPESRSALGDAGAANFVDVDLPGVPAAPTWNYQNATDFTWNDLAWLRGLTDLPLVLKGIQTADDAKLAVDHGIEGIVVSNHGGFALHGATGTLRLLPEVIDAVGEKLEIYMDGGVRHGTDVLKAVALGARAVLIGRPMLWGLCVSGEDGVLDVLEILRGELDKAMGMCGVSDIRDVESRLVSHESS